MSYPEQLTHMLTQTPEQMAKPGIPVEEPKRRAVPYVPDPFPQTIPFPKPAIMPEIMPREPVTAGR